LDGAKPLIDGMLREDLDAPRKQRHTARRVLARLVDEHQLEVSYSSVRDYVAKRRPEIAAEAGRALEAGFVPQTHLPGAEAEVDFADLWIDLCGVRTKVFLFTLRLSCSGRAVHKAFGTQGQEAFLDGHQHAFSELGGVPFDKIRYDNLKSAVSRVLFGRNRSESDRWVLFRSHMGFDAFYCQPGVGGAHEKGGVEGEGGRFRRTHLVPVPKVDSLAELNARLVAADRADDHRRITNRVRTVGQDFALEAPLLRPLPSEVFQTGLSLEPLVDRYARITVRQSTYSVPARFIGRRIRVLLTADRGDRVRPPPGGGPPRAFHREGLHHRGAGSLPGDPAAQARRLGRGHRAGQARRSGVFTVEHEAFWAAARRAHGDGAGTRELVEVLLLHRHLAHADVVDGLAAATGIGAARADVVAVEARRIAEHHPAQNISSQDGVESVPVRVLAQRVISLTERRLGDPAAVIAGLPADTRPLPTVAAYDELLTRRTAQQATPAEGSEVS
jgi:transposase